MLPKSRDKYSKQQSTISIPSDDSSISFEGNNSSFQDFEKNQKSVKIVGLGVFIQQGGDSLSTFNSSGRTTRNKSKPIHKDEYIIHPTDLNISVCLLHGPYLHVLIGHCQTRRHMGIPNYCRRLNYRLPGLTQMV